MSGLHLALCLVAVVMIGIEPTASRKCSEDKPCGNGEGDCDPKLQGQDCEPGLFCGKNNCAGQFGTDDDSGKDDCCTTHLNFCSHADVIPSTRRPGKCCSKENPCDIGQGDCDSDQDCGVGLRCGNNNCKKDYGHVFARPTDDCCEPKNTPIQGIEPMASKECSRDNPCGNGEGDCDNKLQGRDCKPGLFCGKNNCAGQFGTDDTSGKDDCCTYHLNFCSHDDVIPSTRRPGKCCSKLNPCDIGQGDCDSDQDCRVGLRCGNNNCKTDYGHVFARPTDDCCEPKNIPPPIIKPIPSRCSPPDWRCCSLNNPCDLGDGDCNDDDHCKEGLVCGSNNCRDFGHHLAHRKMDCCEKMTQG